MKKGIILGIVLFFVFSFIFILENSKPEYGETVKKIVTVDDIKEDREKEIKFKTSQYKHAIELVTPDSFINSDPFEIKDIIGKKVIIIDFWTYSCINCQRTLPYINDWYSKYKDSGLEIIGVHTPEFDFEKKYDNLIRAVKKYDIKYPVIQDNEYKTWRAYGNHYWPRKYIIDIDGFIVYDHIGEGAYKETEKRIQELLEERSDVLGLNEMIEKDFSEFEIDKSEGTRTPEIYFGADYSRNQLGNSEGYNRETSVVYKIPEIISENKFYLEGEFYNNPASMKLVSEEGKVILDYTAKDIFIVAGSEGNGQIEIFIDGKYVNVLNVDGHELYTLIKGEEKITSRLELRLKNGVEIYSFTFG